MPGGVGGRGVGILGPDGTGTQVRREGEEVREGGKEGDKGERARNPEWKKEDVSFLDHKEKAIEEEGGCE